MPTVPVVDQTASPAPQYSAGTVTPERNAAPEQQEQLGQQLQQTGETAMRTGATIGDRLAEQVDDATVKKAETQFLSTTTDLLNNPDTGYLHQLGENAINNATPTKQAVVQASNDQLGAMTNPIQKQMLTQVLSHHLVNIGAQIDDHNFVQTQEFAGQSAVDRSNSMVAATRTSYDSYGLTDGDGDSTGDFAKYVAAAEQETLKATQIQKGAPADSAIAKGALVNLHTQIGGGVLSQMMFAREPYTAVKAIYDDMENKQWLTPVAAIELGKQIKTYSEQETNRLAVQQNLSDAQRASEKQPTSSTGTPDYGFPAPGGTSTAQPYDEDSGNVTLNLPNNSKLQAPADGKVTQAGVDDAGQFTMQIQHKDGSVTTFAGLNGTSAKVGDQVLRGQNIATSAPATLWSLADKDGNAIDPTKAGLPPVDLSRITDENVLHAALDGVRDQIKDPVLQQQAVAETEGIVRHNQQMLNAQATQVFKSASDQFYNNGMQWRAIDPATLNQLTGEQRQHFMDEQVQHVLQQYNEGQALKRMSETDLVSDFTANPSKITTDNVEAARSQLSNETYLTLMGKAQELQRNPQGVVEAEGVNDRIKYYAGLSGVNVDPKTPADKQTLTDLTFKVQQGIDQIKAQNHGKATPEQVNNLIQQQLIQRTVMTQGSWWNLDTTFDGVPRVPAQKFLFQINDGTQNAPQRNDTRTFPNGKTGTWDGQGWVAK